jgi:hypothetical protein
MEIQYLTDAKGKKKAVIVPIEQYNFLIKSQKRLKEMEEMEEDLKDYRKAKNEASKYEPFELVVKRIESRKSNESYLTEDVFKEIR